MLISSIIISTPLWLIAIMLKELNNKK